MKRVFLFFGLVLALFMSCATIQPSSGKLTDLLPFDPAVKTGRLANGLSYFIRNNGKPEHRAEMRLIVNTGSVLEKDDERGVAHFLEHLAFNGTLHFKKDALVDALESMGMRFGNDLNASTSYDETVYRLQVPTNNPADVETGLLILEDWARNITLETEEVEKERKVIIEEWRSDRGAAERIREKHLAALFKNSRYAERRPIGDLEVIKTVPKETIAGFYSAWYRPDLIAVVIVGDVDPVTLEQKVRDHFGSFAGPRDPEPRKTYQVPPNIAPLVSIVADKEATESSFRLYLKRPVRPLVSFGDYHALLVESLFHSMLQSRLDEIARKSGSPFLAAFSGQGRMVRTLEAVVLGGVAKEGRIAESLETVLTEVERIKRFGFTDSELDREKQNMLTAIEQSYNERNNRQSGALAQEYIRYYLEDEASPGIEFEYGLYRRFVPEITLQEINRLIDYLFPEENRVLTVGIPEKAKVPAPKAESLVSLFTSVKEKKLEPYRDDVTDRPLLSMTPVKGSIVTTSAVPEAGITEWRLSNGIRVLLKPTDFKNDEIVMQAFSPGGTSVVSDKDYLPAVSAADLVNMSGVGVFSRTELEKKLAGKDVKIAAWIDELQEGLSGSTRQADFETLCTLVYLSFTKPKIDPDVFLAYKEKLATTLKERGASPENVFSDMIQTTISNNHFRARPLSTEMLSSLDREASLRVFKDRFADAGDFTFVFTGSFSPEKIKPLVETYLASLPAGGRSESWKDTGITRPKGIVERTVTMGKDPKSSIALVFHGEFTWRLPEVVTLRALAETAELRLTDVIREEAGGTYGLSVWDYPRRVPRQEYLFFISFDTDPARVEELTGKVFSELEKLAASGPSGEELVKVKELLAKERELYLKNNAYWAALIRNYTLYGESPARILEYATYIKELDAAKIRETARRYLDQKQYVLVVLYPADQ